MADKPKMTGESHEPPGADLDTADLFDGDFDFGDGEALGDLLGGPPPPLPPPPEQPAPEPALDDDIFTSASRPGDDPDPGADAELGLPGNVTRVTSIDEVLLAHSAAPGPRRGPAIVRRDQLRRTTRPPIDPAEEEATRIADFDALRGLAEGAAGPERDGGPERQREAGAPAAQVELDESFYEGIEIASTPEPERKPPASASTSPRAVSRHIVRRSGSERSSKPVQPPVEVPVVAEAPADAVDWAGVFPDNGGGLAPLDEEGERTGERLPGGVGERERTGVYRRKMVMPEEVAVGDADVLSALDERLGEEAAGQSSPVAAVDDLSAGLDESLFRPPAGDAGTGDETEQDDAEITIEAGSAADTEPTPADESFAAAEAEFEAQPTPVVDAEAMAAVVATVRPSPRAAPRPIPIALARPSPRAEGEQVRLSLVLDPAAFRFPEQATGEASDEPGLLELYEREIVLAADAARRAFLHVEAGRAAEQAGDDEAARVHFEDAQHADANHLPAARALRRLYLKYGRVHDALRQLDVELRLAAPGERTALAAYQADLLLAAGEHDLARVALAELATGSPADPRPPLAQISLAFHEPHPEENAELPGHLARAAALLHDPPSAAALTALRGRLLERAGRDEEAQRAYVDALDASPGERGALLGLARLALRAQKSEDAAGWEGLLFEGTSDAALPLAVARRRALLALAAGDAAASLKVTEDLAADQDPLVLEVRADAAARAGRPAAQGTALAAWAAVEPSRARRAEVLVRLAALRGPGDAAGVAQALGGALEADPGDADAEADLEDACRATGDIEGAARLLEQRSAVQPERKAWARARIAGLYAGAGRTDEALVRLAAARASSLPPASILLADAEARLLAGAGRSRDLAELLVEVAASSASPCEPAVARERAARALEAITSDDEAHARAEAAWRQVLETDPASPWATHALVRLARPAGPRALADALGLEQDAARDPVRAAALGVRRAGLLAGVQPEADTAEKLLVDVLGRSPGDAQATAFLLGLLGAGGRWRDACQRILARVDLVSEGPERHALRYRAAALLLDAGEPVWAADLLAPVAAALPQFSGAAVLLERIQRSRKDTRALAALMERELGPLGEHDKSDAQARELRIARAVLLAELYAADGKDLPRAAVLYREALTLRPDDPLLRAGLTGVSLRTGELASLSVFALGDLERAEAAQDEAGKVAAYERLAYIDGELRGERATATLAWESAAQLDPARVPALRALERIYLADGREAELVSIYAKLAAALPEPVDAAAVLLMRARLHERAGEAGGALADHRDVLARNPLARMSLFRIEARARDLGLADDVAVLDDAISRFFEGDARGEAAFLTHAGDALADVGRVDEAMDCFRAAASVLPGFGPALRLWRWTALKNSAWEQVVDAAEGAGLYHLAGVTAMDRAGKPDRAIENLRRVLALDPRHDDAFFRLRRLLVEANSPEDLAQCLDARVAVEPHPGRLMSLHQTLAELRRNLGDPAAAKVHLRAILNREPRNRAALASLSDIAWEQGQFTEAADVLIVRAKLETDALALKDIFSRLGLIYFEHLPNPEWATKSFQRVLHYDPHDSGALERLAQLSMQAGDWRTALGATERLVALASWPADKVEHLRRIARIYEDGFKDRKRAEDALKRALDVDPGSSAALSAILSFFRKTRDRASLRMHLDRVVAAMRTRLGRDPFDGAAYHTLAECLTERGLTGADGSAEAGRCAAELAHALGAADGADWALLDQVKSHQPSAQGLGDPALDELLFHPSIPNGLRQIFRLLAEPLSRRHPPDLRRLGVGKGDRAAASSRVRAEVAAVAAELGITGGAWELYISHAQPTALGVEMTEPMSIVLGASLVAGDAPGPIRFAAARALKLASASLGLTSRLGPEELGALLAGIIRQGDPGFAPSGVGMGAVAEEQKHLARLLSRRQRDEIAPFVVEIEGQAFDHHAFWHGLHHTGNRAGLIASGSAAAALDVLLKIGNHKDLQEARGDEQVEELVRFAVSDEYSEIRRSLAR